MKTKKSRLNQTKLIDTTLKLIAKNGIDHVTIDDIALELAVDQNYILSHIQKPNDIYGLITHYINQQLIENFNAEENISKHDQYFELLMERLDLLKPYKKDLAIFIKTLPRMPITSLNFVTSFDKAINLMMNLMGDTMDKPNFHIKKLGLTWTYLATMRVWLKDDSDDSAKTMAALDKNLKRLKTFKNRFTS